MTGPIDESRHPIVHVGEDSTHTYTPRPWRELTYDERKTVRELASIVEWQHRLYQQRRQNEPGS